TCWKNRKDSAFAAKRAARLNELKSEIAPLKANRLNHHETIHRLRFEEVMAASPEKARTAREKAEAELAELQSRIMPLESEINQLGRQFWVEKSHIVANKYDLSSNRYRELEREDEFLEIPTVTLKRLRQLEAVAKGQIDRL